MLIYYFITNHIIVCYSIFYNIFYEIHITTGYILYICSGYLFCFKKIQGVGNKDLDFQLFSEITAICKYLPGCTGFAWQGFGGRGTSGVASVRSCWNLTLSVREPMLASSKMDMPLAKAKPISDGDSASVVTSLRRGKKPAVG